VRFAGRVEEGRIGDLLIEMGVVTTAQVANAAERQRAGDSRPLGELLIALGYAERERVELALLRQRARRGELSHIDGLRMLDEAGQTARRASSSIDELAAAAADLGNGGRR